MSARSSAKSKSSSCVKRVHLMPRAWSAVVCLITQSIVKLKSIADIQQPCLTTVFTLKLVSLLPTLHVKLLSKLLMTRTISCGIPYARRMRHRISRWMLSKAFSKSTKLMYNCLCHSVHCSMMFCRVNIWSVHPLPRSTSYYFTFPSQCPRTQARIKLFLTIYKLTSDSHASSKYLQYTWDTV